MSKKRITGRFYVFVIAIAMIAFLLIRAVLPMGVAEAVIMLATATDQQYLDAVIVRDETVASYALSLIHICGDGGVLVVAHRPVALRAADLVEEVADHVLAVLGVVDFGVCLLYTSRCV